MRATAADFDVFSFAGAAIPSKTVVAAPCYRKSGPTGRAAGRPEDCFRTTSATTDSVTLVTDERAADERGPRRDVLRRRRDVRADRAEVDGADRARPLRGPSPLQRAGARVPRHQPAHAVGAAAHARGAGHLPPRELSRVAAARRVRADREGTLDAADHRGDAHLRPRVADPGSRPRPRGP